MDKIIILTAVFLFIALFGVIGYILLKIGAKNAIKNTNRTVVKLNHGDIFKFETQLQAKIHSKMVEYLEKNEKPFAAISFEIHDN